MFGQNQDISVRLFLLVLVTQCGATSSASPPPASWASSPLSATPVDEEDAWQQLFELLTMFCAIIPCDTSFTNANAEQLVMYRVTSYTVYGLRPGLNQKDVARGIKTVEDCQAWLGSFSGLLTEPTESSFRVMLADVASDLHRLQSEATRP